ncbi:MAG TPA: response regulator transcription factor [Marmoricola sp.]|jgi:two-component system, OmpR family, response regulator
MVSVLVVDDEVPFAERLANGLAEHEFEVTVAYDGNTGLRLARDPRFDLVVLDLMLPGLSGVEVCRRLREDDIGTPVLVLTARDQEEDETEALNQGADDYLRKPFSFDVLLARCRALQRRGGRDGWGELVVGDLSLDPRRRCARRGPQVISLSRREAALLEYLMRAPGQVRCRHEILAHVWGDLEDPESNLVDVYVGYLRRKIDLPFGTSTLQTVRGQGYRVESGR